MIRAAAVDDVPVVHALIRELAEYEREPDAVLATEDDLRVALFAEQPLAHCLVAENGAAENGAAENGAAENGAAENGAGDDRGEVVGFAIWFVNFSTWLGTHGIYLEDLFVRPVARGAGHGRALLTELARIAVERGYGRVEWAVLDWNEPAQGFYAALGARPQDDWTVWRLTGPALHDLGAP